MALAALYLPSLVICFNNQTTSITRHRISKCIVDSSCEPRRIVIPVDYKKVPVFVCSTTMKKRERSQMTEQYEIRERQAQENPIKRYTENIYG